MPVASSGHTADDVSTSPVPKGGSVMRTLLVVLGLCGLLLAPMPDVASGGPAKTNHVRTKQVKTKQVGLAFLVWEAPSGAKNGQRGALLAGAIDGGAPLLTSGHEGESHEPAHQAAGRRQNQRPRT